MVGVAHHIVVAKKVLSDLMVVSEALHGGIPFWQVLLNVRYNYKECSLLTFYLHYRQKIPNRDLGIHYTYA